MLSDEFARWKPLLRTVTTTAVVVALLSLGAANVALRATWHEIEDGVLWVGRPEGVVAAEVHPGGPGYRVGLSAGDLLLAVNGQPIEHVQDLTAALHGGRAGDQLTYSVLRLGSQQLRQVALAPVPQGHRIYFLLAAVAMFTLLVGLSVRLRRPSDQATLHFFWLCVAFYGVFAFSFSGRFDRLDWFFYWADVVSILMLPPLFLHFSLVFPERAQSWILSPVGRVAWPLIYLPALLMGAARVALFTRPLGAGQQFTRLLEALERAEILYLGVCFVGGLIVQIQALRQGRAVTARRQLRWIVGGMSLGALPFVFCYVLPFSLGVTPPTALELTALSLVIVPLAFASAIVRYRLMDVEVIIKRSLVYAVAAAAIAAIYAVLVKLSSMVLLREVNDYNSVIAVLATLAVVFLARPLKNVIQTTLDRAYYRDRYDYRRALVAFARDLNSDLDLYRLSDRLVSRVVETLLVDRMALMLAPLGHDADGAFTPIRSAGFDGTAPELAASSGVGARLMSGHPVALDDPLTARRLANDELAFWRGHGVDYFVPCVSKEGTIASLVLGRRESGEPLSSEDLALLAAVAGQVATALENGRLYRQLRLKADELDRMREFSENILESLKDGLLVIGPDQRIVRWNQAMEQLHGITRQQAIGSRLSELFDHPFLEAIGAIRGDLPEGATILRVPLVSRHRDGGHRLLVNAAMAPLRTPQGAESGTIIIIEDVTSRAQLEEQLQISEKMASIGLLAAGVAHEVNTPLTGISSFTQMLLEGANPDEPNTRLLEKIERQTFRAAKIVNGLLNLARPARVEAGPVDLHVVLNDVLGLLEHQFRTGKIQVRKELMPEPLVVNGIEHKLQQVFLNLFLNARDAMPKGGWLSIATRREGRDVAIDIGDTGVGIPSEQLSRIYDPFFTTKPIGQGTGLGLSISYGIVSEHGGTITCSSAAGQGTKFTLAIPAIELAREAVL